MADSHDKESEQKVPEGLGESPLDDGTTRLDIQLPGKGMDSTHTEIRVASSPHDSIELRLKKQRGLGRITEKLRPLFARFWKYPSRRLARPSFFSGAAFQGIAHFLEPWVKHPWISSRSSGWLDRLLFLGGRLLMAVGGLLLAVLFVKSFFFARDIHSDFQWFILGGAVFVIVITVGIFLLQGNPALFFGLPLILLLVFLLINVCFYPTADPTFFSVNGLAPAFIFNHLFLILLGLEILWILFLPLPLWLRLLWALPGFYGLTGFVLNLWNQTPLEASWLGDSPLGGSPLSFSYFRPVMVSLEGFLPFSFCLTLLVILFAWERLKAYRKLLGSSLNLVLLLLLSALGWQLLQNHRVPNALTFLMTPKLGLGKAEMDVQGRKVTLSVASSAPKSETDFIPHYRMTLTPRLESKKAAVSDKISFDLKVYDPFGFPVLFLTKKDFTLAIDGTKAPSWNLTASFSSYLLELTLPPVQPTALIPTPIAAPSGLGETPLTVAVPMEGDSFDETLSVALQIKLSSGERVLSVHYFIDDTLLLDQTSPPYASLLNTHSLGAGEHRLKVVADLDSTKKLESVIKIIKGPHSALNFTSPTFGQYLQALTPVSISVSGDKPLASLELLLGDEKIYDWKERGGALSPFQWDTTKLPPGDYLLRVRGKTTEGEQASSWVPVLTGEGKFHLYPHDGKMKPPFDQVVFVMDASISLLDGWDGKSKWDWEKTLFRLEPLSSKLKGVDVGIILFGAKVPYAYGDCGDVVSARSVQEFNRNKVGADMDRFHPLGVSALMAGLEEALSAKPQKIILVTDGADSCRVALSDSLKGALASPQKTLLDVVFLGEGGDKEIQSLKSLAEAGEGHFLQPKDGKELMAGVANLVSLTYQLWHGDQKILEAPLDGAPHSLRPGDYTLNILMSPPVQNFPVSIRNGQDIFLKLSVQGGAAKVIDASAPIQ